MIGICEIFVSVSFTYLLRQNSALYRKIAELYVFTQHLKASLRISKHVKRINLSQEVPNTHFKLLPQLLRRS